MLHLVLDRLVTYVVVIGVVMVTVAVVVAMVIVVKVVVAEMVVVRVVAVNGNGVVVLLVVPVAVVADVAYHFPAHRATAEEVVVCWSRSHPIISIMP